MYCVDGSLWTSSDVARLIGLLTRERQYYEDVVARVPVGLALVSADLLLLSTNRASSTLFQIDTPFAPGKPVVSYASLQSLEEPLREFGTAHHLLQSAPMTITAEGSRSIRAVLIRRPSSNDEILIVAEDPSLWVKAEATPPASTFEALVEEAADLIYTHDLSGVLTFLNRSAERLLGRSRSELKGQSLISLLDTASQQVLTETIHQLLGGSGAVSVSLTVLDAQGKPHPLQVRCHLLWHHGQPSAVQGIAREAVPLSSAQEPPLQAANQALLHEINNVLTVIQGYGELIAESVPPASPLSEDASRLRQATEQLTALLKRWPP